MGTIVDVIRYPYRTTMRFYTDSAIETPVCWYFCSPEAEPLGCYTRFGSGLYGKDYMDRWEGVGETAFGPLDFRSNCCSYPGKARVGTPDQFASGVSIKNAPPPVRQLVDCQNAPLLLLPYPGPFWLDLGNQVERDISSTFDWQYYTDGGIGYILPNVLLTMTSDIDPSLNGSWTLSWSTAPDIGHPYQSPGANLYPNCNPNPSAPQFVVSRVDLVGNTILLTFMGSNNPFCEVMTMEGTPRPANYSGSFFTPNYGNVTATITPLPPTVPPPIPPL